MKIKNIKVGIKSLEEGLQDLRETVKAIQSGKHPKAKKGVYFVSLDDMRQVLTPKRLELLHLIREKSPSSLYELAHLAHRNLKNIQQDISLMSKIGLVSLTREKDARDRVVPHVGYDSLNLQIPVI